MIGVIPAAGMGSRLGYDVKGLVEVHGKRLIEYPLKNLLDMGINRTIIVEHDHSISNEVGGHYGAMSLDYVQQKRRGGIGHALSLTERLGDGEYMFIILGDIIYRGHDLADMKRRFLFNRDSNIALYGIKPTANPNEIKESYGVRVGTTATTSEIVEKPKDTRGLMPFLGLGIYTATPKIFKYIKQTPRNEKGEVGITEALNSMAKDLRASGHILYGNYVNVNTRSDLKRA